VDLLSRKLGRRMACALLAAGVASCMASPPLAPIDAQAVARVQDYLDGLQHFKARFTQAGSDGIADGYVWLDRPGRLRVEYVRPAPKLILANHGRLLLADHLTGATTNMPVARTPLDILLAQHIQLAGGALRVVSVQSQDDALQISVIKAATPGQGMLTLQFSRAPMRLVGVVVQDASGRTNTLALSDLDTGAAFSPALFHYTPSAAGN
jgi:outer membrane lipoprotein-sorting protein